MPPFILSLLSQGLGLIGNAVLSKGKEVNLKFDINEDELIMVLKWRNHNNIRKWIGSRIIIRTIHHRYCCRWSQ